MSHIIDVQQQIRDKQSIYPVSYTHLDVYKRQLIYKAASLEKLYFGFADWHSDETLQNALDLLNKALNLAQERGDRSKIALVHFPYIYLFL